MIRTLFAKPALVAGVVIVAGIGFHTLDLLSIAAGGMRGSTAVQSSQAVPRPSESAQASVSEFDNEASGQVASGPSSQAQSFNPQQPVAAVPAQYAPAGYTAAAPAAAWTQQASPDRTASVAIPSNWRIVSGSQGVVAIQGPTGESVVLGLQFFVQPNESGYRSPEQALSWFLRRNGIEVLGIQSHQAVQANPSEQAEMIVAQTQEQGHKCKLVAVVRTAQIGMGYWQFHISALDAPAEGFDAAAPTMQKIYNSWKLDPNYVNGHFDHAARVHAQTAASVTAWAQSNVHRWDNFNTETDRILRGQSVVENTDTGKRIEVGIGTEQPAVDSCRRNGMNCREVPTGELDRPQ
jgi:hypothetical protein